MATLKLTLLRVEIEDLLCVVLTKVKAYRVLKRRFLYQISSELQKQL